MDHFQMSHYQGQLSLYHSVGSYVLVVCPATDQIIFANKHASANLSENCTLLSHIFSINDINKIKNLSQLALPQKMEITSPNKFFTNLFEITIDEVYLLDENNLRKQFTVLTFHNTPEDLLRARQLLHQTKVRFSLFNIKNIDKPILILQSDSAKKAGITGERYFSTYKQTVNKIADLIQSQENRCTVIQDRSINVSERLPVSSSQSNITTEENNTNTNTNRNSTRHSLPDIKDFFGVDNSVIYYCEITITKFKDPVTREPCLLFRDTDITELKQKERQLKVELRRRKATSDFISNLSHEIRTPLNGIHGMLQYLAETELTHDQKSSVAIATNSTIALTNLLTDVLDFSKIEAGKLSVRPAPILVCDLVSLVEEICHLFGTSVSSKGLSLYIDYPLELYFTDLENISNIGLLYIFTDIMRVRQILINLISNAVKYTPKGYVCVRLYICDDVDSDDIRRPIRFDVQDTGEGIDVSDTSNIFNRFKRVGANEDSLDGPSRPEGTGIGLAIGKQITQLLGGQLLLQSQVRIGSTFTLCLPQVIQADNQGLTLSKRSRNGNNNRFASAPQVITIPESRQSPRKRTMQKVSPKDLRNILQQSSLQVISKNSSQLVNQQMIDFFKRFNIYSIGTFDSPELITKIDFDENHSVNNNNNNNVIYLLDIDISEYSNFDDLSNLEVNQIVSGIKKKINILYERLFHVYSMDIPNNNNNNNSTVEILSCHPVNQGKLFLLIPLCFSRLIRNIISDIPWFTSWIPTPLAPSDLLSLICGKYNEITVSEKIPEIHNSFPQETCFQNPNSSCDDITAYNILVAEDNSSNRLVFKKLLLRIRSDIKITWALTGAEAVTKFRNSFTGGYLFDLCFMDIEMPVMNGFEAVQNIRSLEESLRVDSKLPIVVFTANDTNSESIKHRCDTIGIDDGLSKPYDKDALKKLLSKYLPE